MKSFETIILENLLYNEEYTKKVIALVKEEYFKSDPEKVLFNIIYDFVDEFHQLPSNNYINVTLEEKKLNQNIFDSTKELLDVLTDSPENYDWLIKETEKWAKERAVYNGIIESISILDGKSKKVNTEIPEILANALSVSLDDYIGHDYSEDIDKRWDFYQKKDHKIPFDLKYMNRITDGGLTNKTLNIIMAETAGGKSLMMCHMAASHLAMGKNVLYITMEMAEEKIAKRIDANLLDVSINTIEDIGKHFFEEKMNKLKKKGIGKLIIKEYPIACAGASHFRYFLKELKIKKQFVPDIIYVDYLNICCSTRIKPGGENSYNYVKSIAEELRGLGQEKDVPVVTASQLNRTGYGSDPELTNTSESLGIAFTCDVMWAIIRSEEMDKLGQVMIKQLKNRDGDSVSNKRGFLGLDLTRMRFYDVDLNSSNNSNNTTSKTVNKPGKYSNFNFNIDTDSKI